jgi:transposase
VVTDGKGTPLVIEVTAGQVHESTQAKDLIDQAVAIFIGRRTSRFRKPAKLAGDKAYSGPVMRNWLKARGIKPVIPYKENDPLRHDRRVKFDAQAYRNRCVAEQCVGWLKEYRRIGTRFEKLAIHFHGMLQLAIIHRYLKMLFPDRA